MVAWRPAAFLLSRLAGEARAEAEKLLGSVRLSNSTDPSVHGELE